MKITEFFLKHKKLTHLSMILIILAGAFSIVSLPRQDSPNVNFNILSIKTFYPGASPEDVEINVTDLIEDELERVDGIEELTSFSIEGMSAIFIQLDPDASDADQIKNDIKAAVDRVSNLPKEVDNRPTIEDMKSTDFPVLEVAIIGLNADEGMLRKIAKDMESDIKALGNVGVVQKIGYRKKEIKILCDNEKMTEKYISFGEILNAIGSRNVKLSGGTLESFVDEKKIVTFSEFDPPVSVSDVIVRSNFSGKHIKVSDIATVEEGYEKEYIKIRTNGKPSINLLIKRRGTTDIIDLSDKIDTVVKKYQKTYKSQGIDIVKVVDFSHYTKSLLNIVTSNALMGFILVLLALFIFLNFYTALWVAFGIPMSILTAYMFFPLFDITTNQITLITIIMVLGMLVDDAIVIAENINRHKEEGMETYLATITGSKEVFLPVLATVLTTILCFIPIYFMKGIIGKFIYAIPTVVILTLLASLLESITYLPVHLSMHKKTGSNTNETLLNNLKNRYEVVLKFFLKFKKSTLTGFLAIFLLSSIIFGIFGKFELFPTNDFDLFYVIMETPQGNSLVETSNKVSQIEKIISQIPSELMVSFKTIVGDHRTDEAASSPAMHENWAVSTIYLKPAGQRNTRSEYIIKDLTNKLKPIEGFDKIVVRAVKDGPPVGKPINIRLVSDDYKLSKIFEEKIISFLNHQKGVYDIDSSDMLGKKEIRLKLDHDLMAKVGVTALKLAETIRVAYDGKVATTIRRDGEEIDFRVNLLENQRGDPDYLKELQILNNQNQLIKVGSFVEFEESRTNQTIRHYNGKKSINIAAEVDAKIITSQAINKIIRSKFEQEISETPGVTIVFGGEEKETMESFDNFLMAFVMAILLIYFILILLLDSFLQPLLIMIAIPFGLVGVLLAFLIHGLPMSFIGLIGTLGMVGVVVNDSLVMVTHFNALKIDNKKMDTALLLKGATTRLRPVLLTTITTVLGLLPTAYGWGGYEPFLVPMVLAMSWGLALATIVTLILVPVLYSFTIKEH